MKKECPKCKQVLDLTKDNFYFYAEKQRFTSPCKECQKSSSRRRYTTSSVVRNRKAERKERIRNEARCFVLEYLKKHPCVDCGEADIVVLQFDHKDPETKKYDVANMVTNAWKLPLIEAEIQKCDVRCANCHTRQIAKTRNYWKILC